MGSLPFPALSLGCFPSLLSRPHLFHVNEHQFFLILMLMHILDCAATGPRPQLSMLPLEVDWNCLGQGGSMGYQGENMELLSKHLMSLWVTGAMSASEECSCRLLSPPHLVHDQRMRWVMVGAHRVHTIHSPSSYSPCCYATPFRTLASSLGFTILWGITIVCLACWGNYSYNYLENCFPIHWFYQTQVKIAPMRLHKGIWSLYK